MYRFFVQTLGCKVNSFDSKAIENQCIAAGYELTNKVEEANVLILNTCSVTENATKEARYLARRFKKQNPNLFLVATGCYAQTNSAEINELSEIDFIVPNEVKDKTLELIQQRINANPADFKSKLPDGLKAVSNNKQSHFKSSLTLFDHAESDQTRVFLKVQDGCNGFCTYCLIPYARGASRSVSSALVLDEVKRLEELGVKEIVLTGIHIGDYGHDFDSNQSIQSLAQLVHSIFTNTQNLRLRISSLEPSEVNQELLDVLLEYKNRVCDHFHLPLQSGSDRILKLMRRSYDAQTYFNNVVRLRNAFPQACFGADVIPGFPSETEVDFMQTIEFIKACELNYLHIFPYSSRPNTAASKFDQHLDSNTIHERAKVLRELSKSLKEQYQRKFLGQNIEVLWNKSLDTNGKILGMSKNYLQVQASDNHTAPGLNTLGVVKVCGFISQDVLLGSVE